MIVEKEEDKNKTIININNIRYKINNKENYIEAKGIKYANCKRFCKPIEIKNDSNEIIDATKTGPICPQNYFRLEYLTGEMTKDLEFDENECLNLNIFIPKFDNKKYPVMIWIHGGGYISGSGSSEAYNPINFVINEQVIVVTINYRLGMLGYSKVNNDTPYNIGLLDQIEAIKWVKRNIEYFGGDLENITLFGQSAGGDSIICLLAIDEIKNFFKRVIIQSAPIGIRDFETCSEYFIVNGINDFAKNYIEDNNIDIYKININELLGIQNKISKITKAGMNFGPIFGKYPLPKMEVYFEILNKMNKDILIGCTENEKNAFKALGINIENSIFKESINIYLKKYNGNYQKYIFKWKPENTDFKSCHCIELPFIFSNEKFWVKAPMLGNTKWNIIKEKSRKIQKIWGNFAKYGLEKEIIFNDDIQILNESV